MIAGPSEVLVVADARQRSRLDRRRPARAGRARRRRAGDPHHRRRGASPTRSRRRSSGSSQTLPRGEIAARELARFRRDHPRRSARRGAGARSTASRRSISSSPSPIRRRSCREIRNAGAIFLGRHTPEVIGDYVGRLEPCAADGALGALLLRPFGARLHEAHVAPEARRREPSRARAGGDHARRGRRASARMRARSPIRLNL